jgi:hypothetical protein
VSMATSRRAARKRGTQSLLALLLASSGAGLFEACAVDGVTPDCSSPEAGCGFVVDATADSEASTDASPDVDATKPVDSAADTSADARRDGDAKADG